jgi:hypothetical protein
MRFSFATVAMLVMGTGALWAANTTPCPAVSSDTNGCEFIITVTAVNGSGAATAFTVALNAPDQGPYDAVEDTLVGVINSSGSVLKSLTLSNTAGQFAFDGDGACTGTYSPGPTAAQCLGGAFTSTDPSDYLSLTATSVSNVTSTSGTVTFNNIANGGTSWFDLEGALTANQLGGGATPAPSSLVLLLIGFAALAMFWFARGKFARVS